MNPQAADTQATSKPLMGRLFGMFGKKKKELSVMAYAAPIQKTESKSEKKKKTTEEKPAVKTGPYLAQLTDGQSVIDGTPRSFILNGHTHALAFTFRKMILDGKTYCISSDGITFDIFAAARSGDTLMVEAGAFGKKVTLKTNDAEWNAILRALLSTGSHEYAAQDGIKVMIARV